MTSRKSLLWALPALAFSIVGQGRFLFAPAVWLAPVFLVRFVRSAPRRLALPGFVLINTIALEVAFLGTVPLPVAAHIAMFTGLSLVLGLVFLADRWISNKSASFATTLVLPSGWVAYDFLTGLFGPNGTWGSFAYGLAEQPFVLQFVSITGWTGLTFLAAWFGTVLNWAWDTRRAGGRVARGLAIAGIVFGLVLAFGALRPSAHEAPPTARVALLAAPDTFQGEHLEEVWRYTRGFELSEDGRDAARRQIADWGDRHFSMLEQALENGARLAVWAEVNAALTEAEESSWIARAGEAASRHSAYVGLGLAVFRPQSRLPTQNRFVLLGPDGERVWDFAKATRVPGAGHEVGDGVLPLAKTELGRLSGAICFDMDFPRLLRQAGALSADVLIAPSNDWTEVRHTHAVMAAVRAVEQGFNLVRPTKDGISVVVDPFGRVLASLDTDTGPETVLSADVPTRGVTTLYSRIGDSFSWIACAVFAGSLLFGWRAARTPVPSERKEASSMKHILAGSIALFVLLAGPALGSPGPLAAPPDEAVRPAKPRDTGIAHFEAGEYAAAETSFRGVLASAPGDATATYYLGRIHFNRKETDQAIDALASAVERRPSNSDYHLWLGRAYLQKLQTASIFKQLGLSKKVRAHYSKAIELDPDNLSARESLAGYYFAAPAIGGGSTAQGMKQVEAIKARDPRRGHYALASHYIGDKKYDLAEKEYRAALVLTPGHANTLYRLGVLFQLREDWDQAFEMFDAVLAADPAELRTLYAYGKTAALSGASSARGVASLESYLAGKPGPDLPARTHAYWRLGMIYEGQGDVARATRAYRAALDEDPDNDQARKAIKGLR